MTTVPHDYDGAPETGDAPHGLEFIDIVNSLGAGQTFHECAALMRAVVEAVTATGKEGNVTIVVSAAPVTKGNTDQLLLTAAVKSKVPRLDAEGIFFPRAEGELSTRNPRQPTFDDKLRTVAEAGEQIDPNTGVITREDEAAE